MYGVKWTETPFGGLEPRWTVEPDITKMERIIRQHLRIHDEAPCTISFCAEGVFNKVYRVDIGSTLFAMRVTMPFDVPYKILSEVATSTFLTQKTDIPTPKIIAFDPTDDNDLQLPWMLMDFIRGHSLDFKWLDMSMEKKTILLLQLARFDAQVYSNRFGLIASLQQNSVYVHKVPNWYSIFGIGILIFLGIILFPTISLVVCSLSLIETLDVPANSVKLERIMSMNLLEAKQDVARGPYQSTHDWLQARLMMAIDRLPPLHIEPVYNDDYDERDIFQDRQQRKRALDAIPQLLRILSRVFPPSTEPTILYLHDLHDQNIMVDDDGNLVALLDWEFIQTVPSWYGCQIPEALIGVEMASPPTKEEYPTYNDDPVIEAGVEDLYWDTLREYEKTQLRAVFLDEMERLQPDWSREYRGEQFKKKFIQLLDAACSGRIYDQRYLRWLDRVERGESIEGFWDKEEEVVPLEDEKDVLLEGS